MNENIDDFLEQGLAEALHKAVPPREEPDSLFPRLSSSPKKPLSAEENSVPKNPSSQKSLASMGITRGGVVRNASTVHRTVLNNPAARVNRPSAQPQQTKPSDVLDSADLTPEFGSPTLVTGMDIDLEKRAAARVAVAGITMDSTLKELLEHAMQNNGSLRLGANHFALEIRILG